MLSFNLFKILTNKLLQISSFKCFTADIILAYISILFQFTDSFAHILINPFFMIANANSTGANWGE